MTHLTLFNPSFRRLFADPFFDLPAATPGVRAAGAAAASLWTPPVDVRESDTEVVVEAELPGIAREDIAVRYHDGRLILEGQREEVQETGDGENGSGSWIRRERTIGRFHRSFDLPESLDTSAIRAGVPGRRAAGRPAEAREGAARQIDVSIN